MHITSEEYKNTMQEVIRPQSYMSINIGVINQQAQANSFVANTEDALHLSGFDIFGSRIRDYYYATLEQDFTPADGSLLFAPRDGAVNSVNGYISDKVVGTGNQSLLIQFDDSIGAVDIKGLTIGFGPTIPNDFDIETDSGVFEVRNNIDRMYVTDHIFNSVTFFRVIPVTMNNPNLRFRVEYVTFGLGLVFTNKLIKTASLKSYISLIANDVPQVDFSFTVDNSSQEYNIENEDSTLNFFESGQELEVQMGQELTSGKIEWMKVATLRMKSWESDDSTAKFTATDFLESFTGIYYKGQLYKEGISLYDLALDVIGDMGLSEEQYVIDPYLQTIIVYNPLPRVKHREALQLIANCGRCALLIDNNGRVVLQSSFVPDVTAVSDSGHVISNVSNILTKDISIKKYAMFDQGSTDASGSFYFVPRDLSVNDAFFISNEVSDISGYFETNPIITINLEAVYNSIGLVIGFDSPLPDEIILRTYNNGETVDTLLISDVRETTIVSYNFINFDRLEIEITKMSDGNTRARIKSFVFGNYTDYLIEYKALKTSPKGKQLEKVQSVSVAQTHYIESSEAAKQIYKSKVLLDENNNLAVIQFTNPSYDYTVQVAGYSSSTAESGVYYIVVQVEGLAGQESVEIIVTGKTYVTNTAYLTNQINTQGYLKTWTNPLISEDNLAQDVLEWIFAYYASDREYELSYRGDMALEANDLFYLESAYKDDLQCRIYEHSLSFSGAISSKIKARRDVSV